ncbi:hypothetical protein KK090_02535 [Curtobacterium flaccumfaciens pv. poinsettiae]|uniref:hypothetical protein n=1 Tax=Curtobacterium poinsettiae TaxID=159612 RepID=UPI001BE065C4|nr:hypothetical protein [Curtobacterium flaccumfaciens]MBT1618125.1 hypothetical protein [Curtobacterium flaccumfaciens pv. poinsettiae]
MYLRVVTVVAVTLFVLQTLLAAVIVDFFDREFPQSLGTQARWSLDYSRSPDSRNGALEELQRLDAEYRLGLVKVVPDLGKTSDQVYVPLSRSTTTSEVTWFGSQPASSLAPTTRLRNSQPDGTYLITSPDANSRAAEAALQRSKIEVRATGASALGELRFFSSDQRFFAPLLAGLALISALTLFWLSAKARNRALRVLGGTPALRIQARDLGRFFGALLGAAIFVDLAAAVVVWAWRGAAYVTPLVTILVAVEAVTLLTAVIVAAVMSGASWPRVELIARRQPAVKSLRWTAVVVQVCTFALLIGMAGPTWAAYQGSEQTAKQLGTWKDLADEVSLSFSMNDDELVRATQQVGEVVADAEKRKDLALSYTLDAKAFQADFGNYSAVSFVNERWISLVSRHLSRAALRSADSAEHRKMLVTEVGPTLDLWAAPGGSGKTILRTATLLQPADGTKFPVASGGSGSSLVFSDRVLLVVVPSATEAFTAANLTSMATTANLTFGGAGPTQRLLDRAGLTVSNLEREGYSGSVRPVYVAEAGILQAQYATYVVWLLVLSMLGLIVAFVVAAAVDALILALLHAKRDYPLRLSGNTWLTITRRRVLAEAGAAVVVSVIILLLQPWAQGFVVIPTAVAGVGAIVLLQVAAVRSVFKRVTARQL